MHIVLIVQTLGCLLVSADGHFHGHLFPLLLILIEINYAKSVSGNLLLMLERTSLMQDDLFISLLVIITIASHTRFDEILVIFKSHT
jgi:hypothetical protein